MKYNFDQVINRKGTNSSKWDRNVTLFGTDDVIDMWVADMDFACPEPIVKAVQERASHPIYGYSIVPESLYQAIIDRVDRHWGWKIKREWIVFTSGVVDGFYTAIEGLTHPGDEIIIQPPVYYPFANAVRNAGATIANNPLKWNGSRYVMDFEGLEKLFEVRTLFPARSPRIKAILLCSPHNPVGRVWSRDELAKLAEICLKHDCVIMSDEIHADLMIGDAKHTVTSTLSPEVQDNTITFMAASKTFNVAGLRTGFAVVPNPRLRTMFNEARAMRTEGSMFGYAALEAAYRDCDDYLEQLKAYLTANVNYFADYVAKNIPGVKVVKPEGTYLVWVDFRELGMNNQELQQFVRFKARIALDDGYAFGEGGAGFERFNMACPRSILVEVAARLEKAVKEYRKEKGL